MRYGDPFGHYEINPFPGNSQICVFNHAFVDPEFRGQGHGLRLLRQRLSKAKDLGYDYAICTVVDTNHPQLALMKRVGFQKLDSFLNRVSRNGIYLYGIKIERS